MNNMISKVLIIDGYNFIHRARSGFMIGDHSIIFNFFRNLRSLVDIHKPTQIYFVLEGVPVQRFKLLPTYKASRIVDPIQEPKKHFELVKFHNQKDVIIRLLTQYFPISVLHHPDFECDDVIFNLIKRSSTNFEFIVASNDSDFTQLLNKFSNVKIYNPMKKTFVEKTEYDYVAWKSLRGDGSDNIPGIPGVGDKTAEKLINDDVLLREFFDDPINGQARTTQFNLNHKLISFEEWSNEDALKMSYSTPIKNWDAIISKFDEFKFQSILKEKTWEKYVDTFNHLFENVHYEFK
jgi:DNA polymerase-1